MSADVPDDDREPAAPAEGAEALDEVRGRPRDARVPAAPGGGSRARQTSRSARSGRARRERDEHDAERRPGRERDPGEERHAACSDPERAEQDEGREDDAVEQALGEERPRRDERRHVRDLAHRLDPEQVAAAGRDDVVRRPPDRDRREELPERDAVAGSFEQVAPAEGHDGDVDEHEARSPRRSSRSGASPSAPTPRRGRPPAGRARGTRSSRAVPRSSRAAFRRRPRMRQA